MQTRRKGAQNRDREADIQMQTTSLEQEPSKQRFSTFLMLRPFNTLPHVVLTPAIFSSCDFVSAVGHTVNI